MNAKVSAEAMARDCGRIRKDSAFAFNAAQKLKFKSCCQTIQIRCGRKCAVTSPFGVSRRQSIGYAVATQPASVQSGTAPQSNTVTQAATNPYAAKAVAAVRAAQAAAKASQAKAPQPVTQMPFTRPPLLLSKWGIARLPLRCPNLGYSLCQGPLRRRSRFPRQRLRYPRRSRAV